MSLAIHFLWSSAWSPGCSVIGSLLERLVTNCPACSPTLHCPTVACHCRSVTLVPCTPCGAAIGGSWSQLAAAYVAGVLTAVALTWRLRLWAAGGWTSAGQFAVGDAGLALVSEGAAPPAGRRELPLRSAEFSALPALSLLPQPSPPVRSPKSRTSSVAGTSSDVDVSVWGPRMA